MIRDDEQIRKYGDLVRNEGRRLTEMVEQILEFAGIHSGQRGFALRPVAVRPLLDDVVDASRALVEHGGMTVEIDVPEALSPVLGDDAALRRVFQNLVGNAIKYGASGGWIGLRAQASGGPTRRRRRRPKPPPPRRPWVVSTRKSGSRCPSRMTISSTSPPSCVGRPTRGAKCL